MTPTHTTPGVSREQLIAALKLCVMQLNLYSGQHDAATRQIIAECQLILRTAKLPPKK